MGDLEGSVGLVDARDVYRERYTVLVVRQGKKGGVTVQGLEKRPELNGVHGVVQEFKKATQRYEVELDTGDEPVDIKEANLVWDWPETMVEAVQLPPQCVVAYTGKATSGLKPAPKVEEQEPEMED